MEKTLKDRLTAPTPKFFKKVRKIAAIAVGTGLALAASPVAVPAALVSALIIGGTVGGAVAQAATDNE